MSFEFDKSGNQSTQMAFRVIELMVEIGRPVALADLSRQLDIQKVRVHRFLRTLLQLGYVLQDLETDRYRLSYKLYHLGQSLADGTDLLRDARPLMVELSEATGFTVSLSQMEPTGMRILDMVRSSQPVEIVTRPGALLDFHASAQGKVAMAFGGARLAEGALRAWTDETPLDPGRFAAEVAEVHARGWAEAPNQTLPGVTAISAPVFDMTGRMAATLTIAGPTASIGAPAKEPFVTALRDVTRRLSIQLGNTDPK
ncbi:IclR family transcriptional regulator [Frigidibacter sp. MR17.14]|uniref:IclR family transcriptional regulator n=1 Tax=Frigidibacter sp. MR17.14 TaxID=3126509 RepID=UPI0030130CE9